MKIILIFITNQLTSNHDHLQGHAASSALVCNSTVELGPNSRVVLERPKEGEGKPLVCWFILKLAASFHNGGLIRVKVEKFPCHQTLSILCTKEVEQFFFITRVSAAFGRQNPSWIVGW